MQFADRQGSCCNGCSGPKSFFQFKESPGGKKNNKPKQTKKPKPPKHLTLQPPAKTPLQQTQLCLCLAFIESKLLVERPAATSHPRQTSRMIHMDAKARGKAWHHSVLQIQLHLFSLPHSGWHFPQHLHMVKLSLLIREPHSLKKPPPPPPPSIFTAVCTNCCSTSHSVGLRCSALAPRTTLVSKAHPGTGTLLCGQEAESRQRHQPAVFKNQKNRQS